MIAQAKTSTSRRRSITAQSDQWDASAAADERIIPAGDVNRNEEFAKAYRRLNELYAHAFEVADYAVALRVLKEINKLLGLYDLPQTDSGDLDGDGSEALKTVEVIRAHLLPLKLAKPDYPIQEHARIAAGIVCSHRIQNAKTQR